MQLTQAQKNTLKAHVAANTNTSPAASAAGQPLVTPFVINTQYQSGDAEKERAIAEWYNLAAGPDYFVHRTDVTRAEVYTTTVAAGDSSTGVATTWEWDGYKAQSDGERDSWKEMFMGGRCNFGSLNNRAGALKIFGTAGNGGANRTHIFNVAKRRASNLERVFGADVVSPPANTGNLDTDARGAKTNPDLLVVEGLITQDALHDAIINGA